MNSHNTHTLYIVPNYVDETQRKEFHKRTLTNSLISLGALVGRLGAF